MFPPNMASGVNRHREGGHAMSGSSKIRSPERVNSNIDKSAATWRRYRSARVLPADSKPLWRCSSLAGATGDNVKKVALMNINVRED
jgi:hypothetical protein